MKQSLFLPASFFYHMWLFCSTAFTSSATCNLSFSTPSTITASACIHHALLRACIHYFTQPNVHVASWVTDPFVTQCLTRTILSFAGHYRPASARRGPLPPASKPYFRNLCGRSASSTLHTYHQPTNPSQHDLAQKLVAAKARSDSSSMLSTSTKLSKEACFFLPYISAHVLDF